MKAKYSITFLTFFMSSFLLAQEPNSNVDSNLNNFLTTMLQNATPAVPYNASTCNIENEINTIALEQTSASFLPKKWSGVSSLLMQLPSLFPIIDLIRVYTNRTRDNATDYQYVYNKSLLAYSESDNFITFLSKLTDKGLGDLTAEEEKIFREHYKSIKKVFSEKESIGESELGSFSSSFEWEDPIPNIVGGCPFKAQAFRTVKEFKYPNITYEYRIEVTAEKCPCDPAGDTAKIKSAFFVISCTAVQSVLKEKEWTFGDPIDPRIDIIRKECCPEIALEVTPVIQPISETENTDNSIYVGAHVGTPVGEEADFFGLSYGLNAGYLFDVGKNFNLGVSAGYTRFTGKETDFGFDTEGVSYIPIKAQGDYNFNDAFGVHLNAGYAVAVSDGNDGGFTFGFGPFWSPSIAVTLLVKYESIAFGEGNLGGVFLEARIRLKKGKK